MHDTAARSLSVVPTFGDAARVQFAPFQTSIRVRLKPVALTYVPTAVHLVALTHDTWLSPDQTPTTGVTTRDHVAPRRTKVSKRGYPAADEKPPTAAQKVVAGTHETPPSTLSYAPTFGLDAGVQLVPFQVSINVRRTLLVVLE